MPIRRGVPPWTRRATPGRPALTGPVILRQEPSADTRPGIILILPIYDVRLPADTLEARRKALVGYVVSPFRADGLMQGLMQREQRTVSRYMNWAVYDGPVADPLKLLYSSIGNGDDPGFVPFYRYTIDHEVEGRQWTLTFASTPTFESSISFGVPALALMCAVLCTLLLTLFVATMAYRQVNLARTNQQMSLLTRELGHRVKNTLAVVQAIATRSMREGRSVGEARDIFLKRLHALARAHTLLLETSWHGASLRTLAVKELEPFGERATIVGRDLALNSSTAQTIALALHELATNAVKYGALSVAGGRVHLSWELVLGPHGWDFVLRWKEHGGPTVGPPSRKGFGHALLSQQIGHGGESPLVRFAPDGLEYVARAPLGSIIEEQVTDETLNLPEVQE
ncbi:MAG: HWE histidine kinase domain-containing protein [Hyphomicrobiaceae bacterium]